MSSIDHCLKTCNELRRFCSQDGLIDHDSLRYTIVMESGNQVFIEIEFEELLADRCGRLSDRVACCGQMCLHLDPHGGVLRVEIL